MVAGQQRRLTPLTSRSGSGEPSSARSPSSPVASPASPRRRWSGGSPRRRPGRSRGSELRDSVRSGAGLVLRPVLRARSGVPLVRSNDHGGSRVTVEFRVGGVLQAVLDLAPFEGREVTTPVGGLGELVVDGEVVASATSSNVVCDSTIGLFSICSDAASGALGASATTAGRPPRSGWCSTGSTWPPSRSAPGEEHPRPPRRAGPWRRTSAAVGGERRERRSEPCVTIRAVCADPVDGQVWELARGPCSDGRDAGRRHDRRRGRSGPVRDRSSRHQQARPGAGADRRDPGGRGGSRRRIRASPCVRSASIRRSATCSASRTCAGRSRPLWSSAWTGRPWRRRSSNHSAAAELVSPDRRHGAAVSRWRPGVRGRRAPMILAWPSVYSSGTCFDAPRAATGGKLQNQPRCSTLRSSCDSTARPFDTVQLWSVREPG